MFSFFIENKEAVNGSLQLSSSIYEGVVVSSAERARRARGEHGASGVRPLSAGGVVFGAKREKLNTWSAR